LLGKRRTGNHKDGSRGEREWVHGNLSNKEGCVTEKETWFVFLRSSGKGEPRAGKQKAFGKRGREKPRGFCSRLFWFAGMEEKKIPQRRTKATTEKESTVVVWKERLT